MELSGRTEGKILLSFSSSAIKEGLIDTTSEEKVESIFFGIRKVD